MGSDRETTSRIDEYVRKCVAEAPPLTPEQRDRIALAFRPPEMMMPVRIAPTGAGALAEMLGDS